MFPLRFPRDDDSNWLTQRARHFHHLLPERHEAIGLLHELPAPVFRRAPLQDVAPPERVVALPLELEKKAFHAIESADRGLLGGSSRGSEEENGDQTPRDALGQVLRHLFNDPGESLFEDIEDAIMREAFLFCHRNQVQAAKLLGISRNVLRSRLIKNKQISALK